MPCSRSGQSYPLPAPPQALMKLPAASNTTIAGAAFPVFGLERARTVQEPDIVLRVDGEARRISELELRWQPRPRRIDLEHRHAAGLRLRRLSRALGSEKTCRWQTSSDDARQQSNETESLALHGFLLCVPLMKNRPPAPAAAPPRSVMNWRR